MRRETNQTEPKVLRYFIGASILLLALMLFSELSCSLLGLCTNWFPPARFLGFWEVMGISTALLFSVFAIRSLRRSRFSRKTESISPSSQDDVTSSSQSTPVTSPQTIPTGNSPQTKGWRPLIKQLSDEEKEHLKSLIEEGCFNVTSPRKLPGSEKSASVRP